MDNTLQPSMMKKSGNASSTTLGSTMKSTKQRAVYSELLSQELPPASVLSQVNYSVHDYHTQSEVSAKTFEKPDLPPQPPSHGLASFDDPAIEPKVISPFVTRPGHIPRKIEIERKKRLYATQDIEALLGAKGVDYSNPLVTTLGNIKQGLPCMPLEAFDNVDFEIRTPAEWLERGIKSDGTQGGLPAKALQLQADGSGQWGQCKVVGYSEELQKFEVDWLSSDSPEPRHLHRMHICFQAEDPFLYVERVSDAHKRRADAESALLYKLYCDCMPSDDLKPLDSEQCNRVLGLALNSKTLKQSTLDTSVLMNEISFDYVRAMNRIVLDAAAKRAQDPSNTSTPANTASEMVRQLQPPEEDPPRPPPPQGTIQLEQIPGEFRERFSEFLFNSFLTKPEIIKVIVQVKAECLKVLQTSFFSFGTKTVRWDEFQQQQKMATEAAALYLKDTWASNVISHIRASLKDVKKGWFNLEESSNEVYGFSKLKKFLMFLNFMMEDSMRYLLEVSLTNYKNYIVDACASTVTINSVSDATVTQSSSASRRLPLFQVDLVVEGEGAESVFAYSTPEAAFLSLPLKYFDSALMLTGNIVQIEKRVMIKLFWSNDPLMASVHAVEDWVVELRKTIEADLTRSIKPVTEYLTKYDEFLEFLKLDVAEYIAGIEAEYASSEETWDVQAVKKLYLKHLAKEKEVKEKLPGTISLGLFSVRCLKVRTMLCEKHAEIARLLVELIATKTDEFAANTCNIFNDISHKLDVPCNDIEEVTARRDYLSQIPAMVREHQAAIDSSMANFAVLDQLFYHLPESSDQVRWRVFGAPKMVDDKINANAEALDKKTDSFQTDMEEEQDAFVELIKGFNDEVNSLNQYTDLARLEAVAGHVRSLRKKLNTAEEDARLFNSREALFGKEMTQYTALKDVQKLFEPYYDLWTSVDDWTKWEKAWKGDSFLTLDAEDIEKKATTLFRSLTKAYKFFEKKGVAGYTDIACDAKEQVDAFRPNLPLITALRNPGMRERHWEAISSKIGKSLAPDESYTLQKVLDQGLQDDLESITKISENAGREFRIEMDLDKMEAEWNEVLLQIIPYKETGTCVLKGIDDLYLILDEHITNTQAMSFSNFKGPFEQRIDNWNECLQTVSEVIDEWVGVQKNWLYLQPIFDSADINKQLPIEGKRFSTVDKHWRQTMTAASSGEVLAIKFCNNAQLLERYRESNKLLDMVQRGLSDYLQTKQAAFSRFYFLSDGDLLEILSETKDPKMVQPHLKKCFEGIKSVDFKDDLTIVAMTSSEKEHVIWNAPVDPKNKSIEVWMTELQVMMLATIRQQMILGIQDYYETKRTDWMQKWPGQVVINASQFQWTAECEEMINESGNEGVKAYYQQCIQQLADMVQLVRGGKLTKGLKTTIGALATMDVHARDVLKRMAEIGVSAVSDFEWMTQMRFYWEGDTSTTDWKGDLKVIMMTSKRAYGYEYLGNSFRLVITPLTDKCYLTLMGALQMILGGAPAGPAGTGKTETTKDLAKALAKQCVVFNCSDGLDYRAMGKFFKGLAGCGAWACFDEFNRIDIEVLSVIAQQVLTLQGAVQRGEKRIIFEETDIFVDPEFAVYITMNPGYAGRSALPDNLEALFRPVAMMVPNYALIGEIMMFSYGYLESQACAQKMVATFSLCAEQLSAQDHYDYGMRAVKTVITAAGNLKSASPDEQEQALLLRALQDVNVPKFLAHDLPLFDGILSDLFPGIERPPFDYGPLLNGIKLSCQRNNLQCLPIFMRKNIELYEMICVRHGLMVVGPTGGGKSSCIRTLKETLTFLTENGFEGERYEKVEVYHLNPKSIKMTQLYGAFDENTREWQDGILANLMRVAARKTSSDLQWMLFDGPVDAIWIENMNTVLDDNKKLCLTSGEIMALSDQQTMMFEPEDLAVASPATVSRCGMIYMEPTSLGYDPLVQSWLNTLPPGFGPEHRIKLQSLCDTFIPLGLSMLNRFMTEPFPTVNNNLVQSLMNLMDCYFEPFFPKEGEDGKSKAQNEQYLTCLEPQFIFSMIWSIACTVPLQGRKMWDTTIRAEMVQSGCELLIPDEGQIYDYFYDNSKHEWVPWMKTVDEYVYNSQASFAELIIPTLDSVRYTYILDLLVNNKMHVFMTGPTGTGKTVNINTHLQTGFSDKYVPICITFSAQTSANQTQDLIDSRCEKRRKGVYGPSAGKTFILFVDDVNMPLTEEYGAQPPIELLRQWFDSGGWYDRKALTFRTIIDTVMVCSCGPPGGGRNPLTARFPRHFNTIGYTEMEDASMALIFQTILGNFASNMEDEVKAVVNPAVHATIEIYNTILDVLRPTPAKSHYQFNLRDVSKIFQGLLMMNAKKVPDVPHFAAYWYHELRRVFGDRLTTKEDSDWLDNEISRHTSELGVEMKDMFAKFGERIMCVDYLVMGADPRIYELVEDVAGLQPLVEEYLMEYNADVGAKQPMNLVMFMDAIQHVSRIARVIRQPGGNALLLGVGGSGRQSLTKLATFMMADFELYSITIAKGYGPAEWRDNLRECLMKAGVEDKNVVFLFNDTQVVFESMLEDVNNILNTGDVPNLYNAEDVEAIMTACKPECVAKRLQPTKLNILSVFVAKVKANIHMVLCMSPLGNAFRDRLRKFPSIVNCCTIDWFHEWPEEALQSVAMSSMTEQDLQLGDHLESTVSMIRFIHQSVSATSVDFKDNMGRHVYVTPTSYLELLSCYKSILAGKRKEVGTLKSRLETGLEKLLSTAEQVAGLQESLTALQPVLVKTQGEVEEMIVQIDKDKAAASETQVVVEAEETSAQAKKAETEAIAQDAQRDLDEALPALDAAVQCLKELKKADIDEVKNFSKPTERVALTMEAVCIMFETKPVMDKDPDNPGKKFKNFFLAAKKELLSKGQGLVDMMKDYDRDNIPESTIHKIKPLIENPDFDPELVRKASTACRAMCMWCRAMYTYHQVVLVVEPKKKLLAEAQASLKITMETLAVAQGKLKAVMDKIALLESNFNEADAKKNKLLNDTEECAARLERAQKLIGGLGGERTRWTESCAKLAISYGDLDGDSLVSAGMISYGSPFTPLYRKKLISSWHDNLTKLAIPHAEGCDITSTLADPVLIRQWSIFGLPQDANSVENGIIMSKARRYPLLIDPQGQANKYIKNMGNDTSMSEYGLECVKLTEKNFLRTLENGVRFGKWVLMENIGEHLDASLEPLLLQQKFMQGGTEMINIGDSSIPWNNSFRFFMTTKLPNPHYPPEVCVKVTLVNFAITPAGLEDQLLGVVVIEERPDMEEKKNQLVLGNARMAKELAAIEDKILFALSNSTGNILDDHELIEMLAVSKKKSEEIKAKVADAKVVEKEIDINREKYRPVAFRGTLLYFAVADLREIDPMYQYSLQWFISLFINSIRQADPNEDLEERLKILIDHFTYYIYVNCCRSLFEKDKLLLSFLISIRVLEGYNEIDSDEWTFLISGKTPRAMSQANPADEMEPGGWINGRMWTDVLAMSGLTKFEGFETDFCEVTTEWQAYFDSAEPHTHPLPGKWQYTLNSFQKLCVLRCLRPDRVPEAIMNFVVEKMGQRFVEPPPFHLPSCFEDATITTPLIFVLSKGSDPAKAFLEFAKEMRFDKKVKMLSLGQGQGTKATNMIQDATQKGLWAYLQNCHLFLSWLTTLERICDELSPDTVHKDFRLWLTSMPSPKFPVAILQNGVKMTNEPPKGLKANLRNAYFKQDNDKLGRTRKPDVYKKLLFSLCFFHAVVQERRKFGPLGWNIPYEFNDTDLDISLGQLEMFLDQYEHIPFTELVFLTSYINYGGRVTDYIDLRTIDIIMKDFYRPAVLDEGHKFSQDGTYISPAFDPANPHKSYVDYVEKLPLIAGPNVFGLHENANITCANAETFGMFDTLLSLQSKAGGGKSDARDEMIGNHAREIEEQLATRGKFDMDAIRLMYPIMYNESMNTVLVQECIRYNKLIDVMEESLPMLQNALKGLVVLSKELEAMGNSFEMNTTPTSWENKAYPSMKPLGAWADDLMARLDFIIDWVEHNAPPVFWISGFYFPQAFLTGTRQNYARKMQYAIDTISFDYPIIDQPWETLKTKPEDGAYIRGLYMEGARWNPEIRSIDESLPKQLFTSFPVMLMSPIQNRKPTKDGVYQCPIYKVLSRRGVLATTGHSTNFVMWVEVPSNRTHVINYVEQADQEEWIKAGVACFCALNY